VERSLPAQRGRTEHPAREEVSRHACGFAALRDHFVYGPDLTPST